MQKNAQKQNNFKNFNSIDEYLENFEGFHEKIAKLHWEWPSSKEAAVEKAAKYKEQFNITLNILYQEKPELTEIMLQNTLQTFLEHLYCIHKPEYLTQENKKLLDDNFNKFIDILNIADTLQSEIPKIQLTEEAAILFQGPDPNYISSFDLEKSQLKQAMQEVIEKKFKQPLKSQNFAEREANKKNSQAKSRT